MIKRHPPHCPGARATLDHAASGNAAPGLHIHSRTAGWAHKADVSTSLLCPFCADFLSLLASATWATASRRDVYGCTFRRKTRPRWRAEYHANRRSCAVWLIDSSKIGVLARLIGVSVKPDRRDVTSQTWLFDSGGSINTSLTAPPPHQSSCNNPEPYSP